MAGEKCADMRAARWCLACMGYAFAPPTSVSSETQTFPSTEQLILRALPRAALEELLVTKPFLKSLLNEVDPMLS